MNRPGNRLLNENSPYLLSHAYNPVDWYPWGQEALDSTRQRQVPIFLSIGYAACHWCHVMERESFENAEIAGLLNQYFVCIKVDREQRPDLDHIYMSFTQAMSGSGGWPMSVFLTPDLKPFFAGTYFPPDSRWGRPGFKQVLAEITAAWQEQKQSILESAEGIFEELRKHLQRHPEPVLLGDSLSSVAANSLLGNVDHAYGGFGQAPKFPHPMELSLLLREYKRTGDLSWLLAVQKALGGMMRGGIYDQIGGGFARYSVDAQWLVPHFEKMLYDNALLVRVYAEAWQVTGQEDYRRIVIETLDFLIREMSHPDGGFYSAIDADSEGHEGLFYLWTADEITRALGDDAAFALPYFNVTESGNFEGRNILHLTAESDRLLESLPAAEFVDRVHRIRERLLTIRNQRVRPLTDDKILTSWNGLALSAMAIGFRITGEARFLEAARRNARFVMATLHRDDGLVHAWRDGVGMTGEFLEDYAHYIAGLIDLYQSDPSAESINWLTFARQLLDRALPLFMDDSGTLYLRPANQADLIMRPSDPHDSSTPAPGSVFLQDLALLARLFDNESYRETAEKGLRAISGAIARYPAGNCSALRAWELSRGDRIDIVIVGDGEVADLMRSLTWRRFLPQALVLSHPTGTHELPHFENRTSPPGTATAWICRNSVCRLPATTLADFEAHLAQI